jgi:hypothetical protein
MSIITELNNPTFGEVKALELIREAQRCVSGSEQYHEKLTQAISVLSLVRIQREKPDASQEAAREQET